MRRRDLRPFVGSYVNLQCDKRGYVGWLERAGRSAVTFYDDWAEQHLVISLDTVVSIREGDE